MSINDWPISERPREKLLKSGAAALSDAELLALFIGTGRAGKSAAGLARELLNAFGGIAGIMRAKPSQLQQINGIGPSKAAKIAAICELAQRSILHDIQRGEALTSPTKCQSYLRVLLAHKCTEAFWMLMLDNQHKVLASISLSEGTIDQAAIYPREVINQCLQHNASAVIFAHNHPSGVAEASNADIEITKTLKNALNSVDIRLLDHFIVSARGCASMAERGQI